MFEGVLKNNRTSVAGAVAVGAIVAVSSFSAVHAGVRPMATTTCSSGTACIEGDATDGTTWGVYGIAAGYDGVHGVTNTTSGNSGTSGISSATTGYGHGVYGRSANGEGVYGSSSKSGAAGVYGTSVSGNGVEGHSTDVDGAGVHGYALGNGGQSAVGVQAEAAGQYQALGAQADSNETTIFYGLDTATGDSCSIDPYANLVCSGSLTAVALRRAHTNSSGQHVLAYASESASATIEDFGTATLVNGEARIAIEPAFAATIDRNAAYRVFMTPMGDTRGLYVSVKTPAGFEVREAQGGRSNVSFDYRIVARPADAKSDRLPLAPKPRLMPVR